MIQPKKSYEKIVADKIIKWVYEYLYKPLLDIMKDDYNIINDLDVINEALKSGLIYYQNGAFYSSRKKFSNLISLELEKLGAKYSKYRKAYIIDKSKLPPSIMWSIDNIKVNNLAKYTSIVKYLDFFNSNIDEIQKDIVFDKAIDIMLSDLQKRVNKNFEQKKIEVIEPKLDDKMARVIKENYIENMNFYIKKHNQEETAKLREVIGQMVLEGKSQKTITEYIINNFEQDARHAKFLARNEAGIVTTEYLKERYINEGYNKFKWITNLDGRERPLHKELNGKIFSFDDPPIIDERTGQRGLPKETYNCRCTFVPVIDKEFIKRRKGII